MFKYVFLVSVILFYSFLTNLYSNEFEKIRIEEVKNNKYVAYVNGKKEKTNTRKHKKILKILSEKGGHDIEFEEWYLTVLSKIRTNELLLLTIENNASVSPNYIDDSIRFYVAMDNHGEIPIICIYPQFFNLLKKRPSLALSLLVFELSSASFYFENPEQYREAFNIPVEAIMYSMDSYYRQGQFLDKYYINNEEGITSYEHYLLTSYRKDQLRAVAGFFLKCDLDVLYSLYKLSEDETSLEDSINMFVETGKSLLEEHSKKMSTSDLWEKYVMTTKLLTYTLYGPQLAGNFLMKKDSRLTYFWEFDIENYPEIDSIVNEVYSLLQRYQNDLTYFDELRDKFKIDSLLLDKDLDSIKFDSK